MGFGIPGRVMLPNNNICLVLERIIPCEKWGNLIMKRDNYPRRCDELSRIVDLAKSGVTGLKCDQPGNIGHQVAQIRDMATVC